MKTFIRRLFGFGRSLSESDRRFMREEEQRQEAEVQERLKRVREQLAILDRRHIPRENHQ